MVTNNPKWKLWLAVLALALVASACGLLSDDEPSAGEDSGIATTGADNGDLARPSPSPTATPTAEPTVRPTATPPPTPTATPAVPDSYTDLVARVRSLFVSSDLQTDVATIVPLPFSMPVPPDATLERVELVYRQWDVWAQIVGDFPPVDTPADVWVTLVFLTQQNVDDLRVAFGQPAIDAGYVIDTDNSTEGSFSDIRYELNGGVLSRGKDGEMRVNIFDEGDATFVEVSVVAELDTDSEPILTQWPQLLTVPFSGAFQDFSVSAVRTSQGIQVSTRALWIIGSRGNSQAALMATLANEYPNNGVTLDSIVETAPTDPASALLGHPTGSSGRVIIDFAPNLSYIEFNLVSLPG
jgi:hypothetical protein